MLEQCCMMKLMKMMKMMMKMRMRWMCSYACVYIDREWTGAESEKVRDVEICTFYQNFNEFIFCFENKTELVIMVVMVVLITL